MVVSPPGRFSMTTGARSRVVNSLVTMRAITSVALPAGKGTITVIGRLGQSPAAGCVLAVVTAASRTTAGRVARRRTRSDAIMAASRDLQEFLGVAGKDLRLVGRR